MLSCVLLCMIVWGEIVSEGEGRISLLSKGVFASANTLVVVDLFFVFCFLKYSQVTQEKRNKRYSGQNAV